MIVGTIHPAGRVVARQHVSRCSKDGCRFQLGFAPRTKTPVLYCYDTNQTWTVKWDELISLAIDAGISTEGNPMHEPSIEESEAHE